MAGKLYVTGTPIGNLSDITPRILETLRDVDFIAAEDTRVTGKLLTHFGIKKSMISYHEHNIRERGEGIIKRILSGENCAIVTDAGMPCISDPGEDLVKQAVENNIEVLAVPAASAVITALAVSGMDTTRFTFEGFLSVSKSKRKEHLESIEGLTHTLIFYEAPHKLINTLTDLYTILGDRKIALCRELTKIHEEIIRGKISEILDLYSDMGDRKPRGEFVIIVEGKKREEVKSTTLDEAVKIAKNYTDGGMKGSDAAKLAAKETGYKKSEIYKNLF